MRRVGLEEPNDPEDGQPLPIIVGASAGPEADDADNADNSTESGRLMEFEKATSKPDAKAPSPVQQDPMLFGVPLKWVSLLSLTLQTSAQALLIRWSKAHQGADEEPYLSSAAVFCTEVVKAAASLALVVYDTGGVQQAYTCLLDHFTQSPSDLLKAAVPSLIYTVQNNLMFYSFEKLNAPVQQVLYQMKIVTTAGIGVLMLGKSLSATQWSACFMLASGVAMVQWPRDDAESSLGMGPEQVKGFFAVLSACCTSGFAGVWIQKMLQQTTASIWVRNVQLALFGSVMSIMVAMFTDGEKIANGGLTQGFNNRVVAVILMTAFGGLLCAVMLKYAGATHGCFSTALSIILTSLLSQGLLGEFRTDFLFCSGTLVAVSSSVLFSVGIPEGAIASATRIFRRLTR